MAAAQHAAPRTRDGLEGLVAGAICALAAALYITFSVVQWRNFSAPSWDLGIFTQLEQQYSRLAVPIVDIKGPGYNLWGDHFHPILILIAPIFRLFPSGLTLLIVQDVLFALSILPIAGLAQRRLGRVWGALLAVSYALSWGLASAVESQFHEIAFAVPLLAFGLVAWLEGRLVAASALIGALVFVKEDLGLTVAAFGLVLLWSARRPNQRQAGQRRTGIALLAWGILWFCLTIWVILPHFSAVGTWEYGGAVAMGGPGSLVAHLFWPPEKLFTLLLVALACGVVGLASPVALLALPTLAWRFVGGVEAYWGWHWHYSAVLTPIAFVALVDGACRIGARLSPAGRRRIAAVAVSISLAGSLVMAYSGPWGQLARGYPTLLPQDRAAAAGLVDVVGQNRRVVADLGLLAYLAPGNTVFWEGTVGASPVDAVALTPQAQGMAPGEFADRWAAERFGGTWTLVFYERGFQLAERTG